MSTTQAKLPRVRGRRPILCFFVKDRQLAKHIPIDEVDADKSKQKVAAGDDSTKPNCSLVVCKTSHVDNAYAVIHDCVNAAELLKHLQFNASE